MKNFSDFRGIAVCHMFSILLSYMVWQLTLFGNNIMLNILSVATYKFVCPPLCSPLSFVFDA